jgi:hypothetical protein
MLRQFPFLMTGVHNEKTYLPSYPLSLLYTHYRHQRRRGPRPLGSSYCSDEVSPGDFEVGLGGGELGLGRV